MATIIVLALLWFLFAIGVYVGRSGAKDYYYIKGYRDGIYDGDKSKQEIISKIKEDA